MPSCSCWGPAGFVGRQKLLFLASFWLLGHTGPESTQEVPIGGPTSHIPWRCTHTVLQPLRETPQLTLRHSSLGHLSVLHPNRNNGSPLGHGCRLAPLEAGYRRHVAGSRNMWSVLEGMQSLLKACGQFSLGGPRMHSQPCGGRHTVSSQSAT